MLQAPHCRRTKTEGKDMAPRKCNQSAEVRISPHPVEDIPAAGEVT